MTIPGVVIVGGAHGTLALARSLGVLNVPVYYLTHDSPLPGWSRFVRETIRWAGPHDAGAIVFLRQMAEKHGLKGCLLVPSGDGEVQISFRSTVRSFPLFTKSFCRIGRLCNGCVKNRCFTSVRRSLVSAFPGPMH